MDINRFNTQLRIAVDTGKVIYGTKETIKECLVGEPKLLIVSKTVKNTVKKQLAHYAKLLNIRFVEYPDKGSELGSVCGKPFNISVISIKDFGQASIIETIDAVVVKRSEHSKIKAKAEKKAKKDDKKAEKAKAKQLKEIKKKKEEEKPIEEDETLKKIIKIKKK